MDEFLTIPNNMDVNINFYINSETNLSISFHTSSDAMPSIEEYVEYFKRAGIALGFDKSDIDRIIVANF